MHPLDGDFPFIPELAVAVDDYVRYGGDKDKDETRCKNTLLKSGEFLPVTVPALGKQINTLRERGIENAVDGLLEDDQEG